ncbi:hypothetical protein AGMMS49991_06790 [Spirochaetia bacterium]|nr:hypothetical protein AGMMS49991_06790 [Spirochaetia bacterium]
MNVDKIVEKTLEKIGGKDNLKNWSWFAIKFMAINVSGKNCKEAIAAAVIINDMVEAK